MKGLFEDSRGGAYFRDIGVLFMLFLSAKGYMADTVCVCQ